MTEIAAHLYQLKQGRTWSQVADLIGSYSCAWWAAVARGERHAKLEHVNLVRAALTPPLPPLEQTAADIVAELGIDDVVQISKRPTTAILAAVVGDVLQVDIKTGQVEKPNNGGIPVTLSYRAVVERKPRKRPHINLVNRSVSHYAAACSECSFKSATSDGVSKRKVQRLARKHVAETGHGVDVETASRMQYIKEGGNDVNV